MVLSHEFYCTNDDCDNEVEHYGEMCNDCVDTLSDHSAHCAGCGEDMFISTNGYCGTCWTEKFSDDEELLTREPLSWYNGATRYCTECDQWYVFATDDEDPGCPECRVYGHAKCTDCRRRESVMYGLCKPCLDERERWCSECDEPIDKVTVRWNNNPVCVACDRRAYGVMDRMTNECTSCHKSFRNDYWDRSSQICVPCEKLAKEIAEIDEKLKTNMTPSQTADWLRLRNTRLDKMTR
jgi:hypothetical protein